jgi:protein-disulfide isomerase
MREHTHAGKVREDFTTGVRSGVSETPAFFINGARYTGVADLDGLLAAIEEAGYRAASRDE